MVGKKQHYRLPMQLPNCYAPVLQRIRNHVYCYLPRAGANHFNGNTHLLITTLVEGNTGSTCNSVYIKIKDFC